MVCWGKAGVYYGLSTMEQELPGCLSLLLSFLWITPCPWSSKRHQSQFLMRTAVEDLSAGDHRRGGWGLQSLAFQVYNVADEN